MPGFITKNERQKNWNSRGLLSSGIILLIFIFLALYLYKNHHVFIYLKNISWQQIIWIILLDTSSYVFMSFQNYLIIRHLGTDITFLDCLFLQYVNSSLNKILPTVGGGAAFRALYLKKKYLFAYSKFVSAVAGLYVISFLATSLIGIFCLTEIYFYTRIFNMIIFICFSVLFTLCLGVIFISPEIRKRDYRITQIFGSVIDGWRLIRTNYKLVIISVALTIMLLLLSTFSNLIIYQSLGFKVNFVPMLYLSTLGIIITLLNFTPDGIGIREGIYALSSKLVKLPNEVLVLGSLVLRGITIITTLSGGLIGYYLLIRRLGAIKHTTNGSHMGQTSNSTLD